MRSLCKTLAERAQQLRFVNLYIETHTLTDTKQDFDFQQLEKATFFRVKTEQRGMELKNFLTLVDNDVLPLTVKEHYQGSGIFLGPSELFKLTQQQKSGICYWIQHQNPGVLVPRGQFFLGPLSSLAFSRSTTGLAQYIHRALLRNPPLKYGHG